MRKRSAKERVISLCQKRMAEQELNYESFDPRANQWIGEE